MDRIKLTVNDTDIEVEKGITILETAQRAGIYIPALCSHPDLPWKKRVEASDAVYRGNELIKGETTGKEFEGCQLCLVEIKGVNGVVKACATEAAGGMVVHTETPRVRELRQDNLAAILAHHPHACLTCAQREGCSREPCSTNVPVEERCCPKLGNCELQKVAEYVGIKADTPRWIPTSIPILDQEPLYVRDYNLCIDCNRCVRFCQDVRGVGALGFVYVDGKVMVGSIRPTLKDSGCKFCGACVEVCPTGTLTDKDARWFTEEEREAVLIPCTNSCPAGIDIPRYVRLIAEGKAAESLAVIREKVPFPGVLGRVCLHPCEAACRRGQISDAISIRVLKRFASDSDNKSWKRRSKVASASGKRVAVIGSGPAGLTAAYYLAKAGHSVTVFDALPEAGGMLRVGIPEYRLPREVLLSEIEEIKNVGVELRLNSKVDSIESLFSDGYDAVFVAVGAHRGIKMGVEGEDSPGVMDGIQILREVNLGGKVELGNRVAVIGGGNVAVDVARTALRLGPKEVTIVYRRTRAEMPASEEEIIEALHEGIKVEFLTMPSKIAKRDGHLELECIRMQLGEPDASGRRRPIAIDGSEFILEFDSVIAAIGQEPDLPDGFDLEPGKGKTISVDPRSMATEKDGVFAGGDVVSGPASVIEAIASGRKAAAAIDRYLGGSGEIEESLAPDDKANLWIGRDEEFACWRRVEMPCLAPGERVENFAEVELGLDEKAAVEEAKLCLRCNLRLQISSITLPPEKWLEFNSRNVTAAPETEGVYQLLNAQKEITHIKGTANLRQGLEAHLDANGAPIGEVHYFGYEEDPMYTARESELIQQFVQKHGRMPSSGADDLDDLF